MEEQEKEANTFAFAFLMLEKEAEEWAIDYVCKDCSCYEKCKSKVHCTCKERSKDKWQNGAEFGYNKVNERLTKAENLLTRFIMGSVYFNGKETDLVEEAEQFLIELEE